jgi:hypothetical protein
MRHSPPVGCRDAGGASSPVWGQPLDQTFNIGSAGSTPVDDRDYQIPFAFTHKINKVTIALDPPKLTAEDVRRLDAANRAAQDNNWLRCHGPPWVPEPLRAATVQWWRSKAPRANRSPRMSSYRGLDDHQHVDGLKTALFTHEMNAHAATR